ncbi:histidine kinase [Salinibacterium sp. ZJ454]|uniref:sensor histidine kinase n=1 Tax=Salinibacterium sp. ZJ454 TaxID=2708339 RepID=UPI0014244314|nr:histidine kinase [Salinibacterium sp. ZJ454]
MNTHAGMHGTWQWTWTSLFALLLLGYAPAALSLASELGSWELREYALVLTGGVSLVSGIVFLGALRSGLGQQRTTLTARLILMAMAVLPWAISSVGPSLSTDWAVIPWVIASLVAVDLAPPARWWWLASIAVIIILIRAAVAVPTGTAWQQIWQTGDTSLSVLVPALAVILPLSTVFQVWLWQVVASLDAAKSERSELARAQERIRFASDLHNIQGHHLQVIALKSELAERLIKRDPDAASALVRETQELAREALEDTRKLVKGYRSVTFAVEAENAAAVLSAAGIDVTMKIECAPASRLDHLLGSMLREATTNIIRHSTATHVEIILRSAANGDTELRISNDGLPQAEVSGEGTGIGGLADDYATVGGTVTATRTSEMFTLHGVIPTLGATS